MFTKILNSIGIYTKKQYRELWNRAFTLRGELTFAGIVMRNHSERIRAGLELTEDADRLYAVGKFVNDVAKESWP